MRNVKGSKEKCHGQRGSQAARDTKLWHVFLLILPKLKNCRGFNVPPFAGYTGGRSASRGATATEAHQKQITFDFVGFRAMIQPI